MALSAAPEPTSGTVPPQNLDAEASVLGSILLTDQALEAILIDIGLTADDFYRPRHQLIFRSMVRLKERSEPEAVDALTVCDDLSKAGELDEAGGEAYIHSLSNSVPSAGHARNYAKIVKDHAISRRLLSTTAEIQQRVHSFQGDPRDLVEQAEAALFKVGHADATGDLRSIEDVLHDELDKLERISREGLDVTGTPSDFKELDDLTGGFQKGNLIVLAARPAMGKSALVTNIAENASVNHGKPVALFSLEMSEAELAQRFIASQARLNGAELRKGRVQQDRWPKVMKATEKLASAPLYVDDSSDIGILEIRAKARRLHARAPEGLGLLVVDYLQLMRPDGSTENRVEQIGQMSRGLKVLARELDIPVIAVSQLSRAVESRPDKRPLLSDLRESGNIEQDADLVMFIYRDDYYNEESDRPGEADIIVAKHRNGPTGTRTLTFLPRFPKFSNFARDPAGQVAAAAGNGSGG